MIKKSPDIENSKALRKMEARTPEGTLHLFLKPQISPESAIEILNRHIEIDATCKSSCLKWGKRSSLTGAMIRTSSGEVHVAVKMFRWRGTRGAASDFILGSRAFRAYRGACILQNTGLSTPEALAYAEDRFFGIVRKSFLITRYLDEFVPLSSALEKASGKPHELQRIARNLGFTIGTLHRSGIDHPDLKLLNILVVNDENISILDLDALRMASRISFRRRIRALGQLEAYLRRDCPWVGNNEREHFLRSYLNLNPSLESRRRDMIGKALEWADRKHREWKKCEQR